MKYPVILCKLTAASLLLIIMSGCMFFSRTPSAHFYVLNSLASLEGMSGSHGQSDVIVGIGPVTFPEYLDRPQIVTRTSSNELFFAEFDRWGGSLQGDFLRVMAENLSLLLSTNKVVVHPWVRSALIEYQVVMRISRFDGITGDNVVLRAHWAVLGDYGRELYVVQKSDIIETVQGNSYSALVEAKSRLIAKLSKEIAQELDAVIMQHSRR